MWKTLWFWKLLLTYVASIMMLTAVGTPPIGIIEFAGIQPPAPPDNAQPVTPEEYYSSSSIKAAVYAIVTGLLLLISLIGKDSSPSQARKAVAVDIVNRAAIALAAIATGYYWLASVLGTNPLPYLRAFGTISSIVLVGITIYIILLLATVYLAFRILWWLYQSLHDRVTLLLHWIRRKLGVVVYRAWFALRKASKTIYNWILSTLPRTTRRLRVAVYLAWSVLRKTPRTILNRVLNTFHWIKQKSRRRTGGDT